jgi:hypothetical protein
LRKSSTRDRAALSPWFLVKLRRGPYESFTDRSGLPDAQSAMLVLGVGRSVRRFRRIQDSVLRTVALIVLATISFLACVFLVFVLVQWKLDTIRKSTTRPEVDSKIGETREEKRPHTAGSRSVERRDRFKARAHRVSTITEKSGGRESEYNEPERIVYERIARSWSPARGS